MHYSPDVCGKVTERDQASGHSKTSTNLVHTTFCASKALDLHRLISMEVNNQVWFDVFFKQQSLKPTSEIIQSILNVGTLLMGKWSSEHVYVPHVQTSDNQM